MSCGAGALTLEAARQGHVHHGALGAASGLESYGDAARVPILSTTTPPRVPVARAERRIVENDHVGRRARVAPHLTGIHEGEHVHASNAGARVRRPLNLG